jgi:hypothetical protein
MAAESPKCESPPMMHQNRIIAGVLRARSIEAGDDQERVRPPHRLRIELERKRQKQLQSEKKIGVKLKIEGDIKADIECLVHLQD